MSEQYGPCSVCGETTRHTIAHFVESGQGLVSASVPLRVCRSRPCRVKAFGSEYAADADSRAYLTEQKEVVVGLSRDDGSPVLMRQSDINTERQKLGAAWASALNKAVAEKTGEKP